MKKHFFVEKERERYEKLFLCRETKKREIEREQTEKK
jgi:hypothetical protein